MASIIPNEIEKEISTFLEPYKKDYLDQHFDFQIGYFQSDDNTYQLEIRGSHRHKYKPDEQASFVLLRLFIYSEWNQIQITNIFLPDFMRYNGIGKKIISKIFTISEQEQYSLFLVDMVNSFYNKMIKRGAIPCDNCDDAVQIIAETQLL